MTPRFRERLGLVSASPASARTWFRWPLRSRRTRAELETALAQEAQTRALLDAVLASAPVGITVVDRDLRFVHANEVIYGMHALGAGELLGKTVAEALPHLADAVAPRLQCVFDTGEAQIGEDEVVRVSPTTGVKTHWLVSRYPVHDAAGEVLGVASMLTDVTELRKTRDELEAAVARERETGALLDALFADAPVGVTLFDRDLRFVRVNATYASWNGISPEEHTGKRLDDVQPGIGAQVEPALRMVMHTGTPIIGAETLREDGKAFRASRYPVRDDRGEVVGVAAIVDDVTELKVAERRLHDALAAEYESRAFLDTLLDHAPLSLTFVDRELRYSLVNQLAASVTGRTREEMLGHTVEEVYPELAPVIVPALQTVLENGEPIIGHEVHDTDPVTGADRFWLVSRFPVRIHGEIVGVTSIRTEVTPMKQLEEQLEQMLAFESSARVEVEQARHELAQIASTDALTGLANRRLFSEHLSLALARCERYGTVVSVLYLDLDGFKAVNDTLGHEEGDKLLCEVADVLRACSRETDHVARLGGDEFLLLLADLPQDEAEAIVATVADRLAGRVSRIRPGVSTSIGIAFAPGDGMIERELLAAADAEMYRNKRARKRAA